MNMQKYKMGELLTVKHGWAFKGEYFCDEGEQSILTPGNFYEKGGFKYNDGKERFYSGEYPSEYLCKKGDLVVAMTEQVAGLLGSTAIVPKDDRYLHNQRIGLITCDEGKITKMFAYYLFMTKSVRNQLELTSSGTKVKHTSPERIYDVEVEIPGLDDQKKIADLLWTIDERIRVNNEINDNLYKSAETKYNYWFNQLNDGLPAGWIRKSVHELLTITTGKEDANFSTENGIYPFFTCSSDALCCDTPAFEDHAVLIAGNGDFNVKHYTGEFNAYQRTYVLIPNAPIYYGAIYFAASQSIQKFKASSNGSIVKFITKGDVENISIVIPNKKGYLEELNQYLFAIEANNQENNTLTSLRDWLLPLLMNGQASIAD